jgi:L-aminopeptidase/D-esterase-like protein
MDWVAALKETGELVQLAGQNTTLGVVATTAPLTREQAGKVAQMAHDGMGRAIRPAHTMSDGDVVFALSLPRTDGPPANVSAIGAMAAEVLAEAILDGVLSATGLPGIPSARDYQRET